MATLRQDLETIILELIRLQATPGPVRDPDDPFPFGRMISVGKGRVLHISRKMDVAIGVVAKRLYDADPALALNHRLGEWRSMTRRAFGPVLAGLDLSADLAANADAALVGVRATLARQAAGHPEQEFAFGCTVFADDARSLPSFGAVRFERREDWLARKTAEGKLSPATGRRLTRTWNKLPVRRRKPSADASAERDIHNAIGTCPFVCSAMTRGLAPGAARDKALMAARLATLAIALTWTRPSGALKGLNLRFDRQSFVRYAVVFAGGHVGNSSDRDILHHAPWTEATEWEAQFASFAGIFRTVEEVLDYVLSPSGDVRRPNLMSTLTQAMTWFHEGCRESSALVAVVKFAAALDALSCAGERDGICRLITARVALHAQAPLWDEGPTLKQAVARIYGPGRSQTIHGTNRQHGHDWTEAQDTAEQLGRLALVTCLDWADENRDCDDPKQLMT
ncbi:MAG: hypothetical protein ACREE0_10930 [Phenylobacterium sp.]